MTNSEGQHKVKNNLLEVPADQAFQDDLGVPVSIEITKLFQER